MNKAQQRVTKVLGRLAEYCLSDEDVAGWLSEDLEKMLTEIHNDDGFGTEGQSDPRGDFRNGEWSMSRVEGIDI